MTFVVIGSGPAGVAAAHALVGAGHRVTMLDAGERIEAGRMDAFDALAGLEPDEWTPALSGPARDGFPVGIRHVPLKPAYGSLFPYALADPDLPVTLENAELLPSLAYGGLSNSWGASILPFRQGDIEDWPIALAELEPHYEAVLRFVPLAGEHDELARILPLYCDSPGELRRGPQAQRLLRHLRAHAGSLGLAGFSFGSSRLAVATGAEDPRRCRDSGMCLYGCPYRSIYNASHTLRTLIDGGGVDYRGGVYVDRLSEANGAVTVHLHRRGGGGGGATEQLSAARVFVGCGVVSSTRLVLSSLGRTRLKRPLQDSQYFVIPMLTPAASRVSFATQGNTLAQVYVELEDESICSRSIHLQLYGYNDLILSALARRVPVDRARLERLLAPLLGRLVVVQGYLHSRDSPGLRIERYEGGVRILGDGGSLGVNRVKQITRRLAASARHLGMLPLSAFVQMGHPGKSNHVGGSLPMRRRPRALETDTLGRLPIWERVHVVDASVLPSIPATTVTLSVMANAHRIADTVARGGAET
jgi:choline dehydrogenase-like flavoprotein